MCLAAAALWAATAGRRRRSKTAPPPTGDEAAKAWRPLAEGGDAMAQFNLGLLHETGRGVADAWYERAALQGVTQAQQSGAAPSDRARRREDGAQAARSGGTPRRGRGAGAGGRRWARLAEILLAEDVNNARARAGEFAPRPEGASVRAEATTLILSESQVEELQRRLAAHGYDPGPLDGVPGEQTRNAVRRYLADRGLTWPEGENLSQRLLDLVRAP